MKNLEISSLNSDQVEKLCEIAEESARKYVMSKVSRRQVSELNITVEAGGKENLTLDVDVEVSVSPLIEDVDINRLAEEAVDAAFKSVEEFLRKD